MHLIIHGQRPQTPCSGYSQSGTWVSIWEGEDYDAPEGDGCTPMEIPVTRRNHYQRVADRSREAEIVYQRENPAVRITVKGRKNK